MLTQEQQIFDRIKKAENILITFDKNWRGDSVASALAFLLFLRKMEKQVDIVADKPTLTKELSFLPDYSIIGNKLKNIRKFIIKLDTTNGKIGKVKYHKEENHLEFIIFPETGFFKAENISTRAGEFKYDLIIALDTPDLESLGPIFEDNADFFYNVPIINIDHNPRNENFGQINLIDINALSTTEILFHLFSNYSKDYIDAGIATCLLAGIITKTKNFKTQNITPQVLSTSSELVALGGDREKIVGHLYRSRQLHVLKLWGRILAGLKSDLENKLIWTVLTEEDFTNTNTDENDLPEVVEELITNIPQANIVVIIYEINENDVNALIFSVKNIDVLSLVKKWHAEGTKTLTKINFRKKIEEIEGELLPVLKENIQRIIP